MISRSLSLIHCLFRLVKCIFTKPLYKSAWYTLLSLLIFRTHAQSVKLGGRNVTEKKHGNITVAAFLCGYARQYIYIYAFSRRFYPKRLTVYPDYTFIVSMCVPWELNPRPFVLLMQSSTTEPQEHNSIAILRLSRQPKSRYCSTLTNHTSMESLFIQRSDDC